MPCTKPKHPAPMQGVSGWEDVGGMEDVREALYESLELPTKYAKLVAQVSAWISLVSCACQRVSRVVAKAVLGLISPCWKACAHVVYGRGCLTIPRCSPRLVLHASRSSLLHTWESAAMTVAPPPPAVPWAGPTAAAHRRAAVRPTRLR